MYVHIFHNKVYLDTINQLLVVNRDDYAYHFLLIISDSELDSEHIHASGEGGKGEGGEFNRERLLLGNNTYMLVHVPPHLTPASSEWLQLLSLLGFLLQSKRDDSLPLQTTLSRKIDPEPLP